MRIRHPLFGGCLLLLCLASARAQVYRNVVNQRFRTVSNGPLHTLVVDVADPSDTRAVSQAVAAQVSAARQQRESAVSREIEFLRRTRYIKPGSSPGIPDIVMLRQNSRLVQPPSRATRGPNDLTFTFVAAGQPGSYTAAQQAELQSIINVVYPEMKNVYGDPSWSGTVQIINGDNTTPVIADRPALSGGVYNVSTAQITFAVYNAAQTKVLNLTQMIALAFHGPSAISYDAWERGLARAATLVTVRNVTPLLNGLYGAGVIDPADPLWNALDRYDLLNQPPLGNDRFYPTSLANQAVNPTSLAGMLVPRLQMSTSAWLKAAEENPTFFKAFNAAYYLALVTNANLKNSVPDLINIMATVVPTVEGLAFPDWYQRQYVLDTSASPGEKLYAWAIPLRPNPTDAGGGDDYAIGVVIVYYATSVDASGVSNETNLNGTCYPIYWDYTFSNRLFLAAQYERVDIADGLGTVTPTFFNTIGGDAALNGMMRVTMDFTVNLATTRLYTAPRSMGKVGAVNNLWGTVVGSDSGTMHIDTEGGVSKDITVKQGAFGGQVDPNVFVGPDRATLTFTSDGGVRTVRKVNIGYHGSDPANSPGEFIGVFYATDPIKSITHTLAGGPQMVSFPIRPLQPKAAQALVDPTSGQPIFNEGNLLLAQWRQNIQADNKYLIYPSLAPLAPGQGYWTNLAADTPVKITGRSTALDADVSVALLHGWNQIGTPYEQSVDINTLQFQYLADNVPQDLTGAIAKGWIVAQTVPQVGSVAVWAFDQTTGYTMATKLDPWKGYWIRVLVSEGVTITYPNPGATSRSAPLGSSRTPATRAAAGTAATGWSVPLALRGPDGHGGSVVLGQSDTAAGGYDSHLDALRPPDFSRSVPAVSFSHPEWGANAGEYYSDIRRTGSKDPWTVTVYTPQTDKPYALTWGDLSRVPRSTRLILVDPATGRRQYLQTSSSFTFNPGGAASRTFQIVAEDRSRTALRLFNVLTRQTRAAGGGAGGVQIQYDLTAGAEVTTEIRSSTGQVVRRLVAGRAAAAGSNEAIWDTRDDRAISVPSGAYVLSITARTPDGDQARITQPLIVIR